MGAPGDDDELELAQVRRQLELGFLEDYEKGTTEPAPPAATDVGPRQRSRRARSTGAGRAGDYYELCEGLLVVAADALRAVGSLGRRQLKPPAWRALWLSSQAATVRALAAAVEGDVEDVCEEVAREVCAESGDRRSSRRR